MCNSVYQARNEGGRLRYVISSSHKLANLFFRLSLLLQLELLSLFLSFIVPFLVALLGLGLNRLPLLHGHTGNIMVIKLRGQEVLDPIFKWSCAQPNVLKYSGGSLQSLDWNGGME